MAGEKIAETPRMKQYFQVKAQYPEAVLLFRVGDFYETFADDAQLPDTVPLPESIASSEGFPLFFLLPSCNRPSALFLVMQMYGKLPFYRLSDEKIANNGLLR